MSTDWSGWAGNIIPYVDTGLSTGQVVIWLKNNLYNLNARINTNYYLDDLEDIAPDTMTPIQSGIYQEIYYCDYLRKKSTQAISYNDYDWSEIEGEKQGRIRKVAKNEHAKTLKLAASECRDELKELIEGYFNNNSDGTMVGMVLYNDRGNVANQGLKWSFPPSSGLTNTENTLL